MHERVLQNCPVFTHPLSYWHSPNCAAQLTVHSPDPPAQEMLFGPTPESGGGVGIGSLIVRVRVPISHPAAENTAALKLLTVALMSNVRRFMASSAQMSS